MFCIALIAAKEELYIIEHFIVFLHDNIRNEDISRGAQLHRNK